MHGLNRNLDDDGHVLAKEKAETAHFDTEFINAFFLVVSVGILFCGFYPSMFFDMQTKIFLPQHMKRVSVFDENFKARYKLFCETVLSKMQWRNNSPLPKHSNQFCAAKKFKAK